MNNSSLRLVYSCFGKPEEVLKIENVPVPTAGAGEVLVRMIRAPVNPADFGRIAGTYGELAELPAVGGMEGLGRVVSGPFGSPFTPGRRVAVMGATWQQWRVAAPEELVIVPDGIPDDQAAMLRVNPPTAILLLEHFIELRKGDWVVQNAATSAVGMLVLGLALPRGINVACLTRSEAGMERLRAAGAEHVFIDNDDAVRSIRALMGKTRARLALNSVGGASALNLVKLLGPRGVHVTFGGITREPVLFPTRQLIFDDISLRGFWMHAWWRQADAGKRRLLMNRVMSSIASGQLRAPVDKVFPIQHFGPALTRAAEAGRTGKVQLEMSQESDVGTTSGSMGRSASPFPVRSGSPFPTRSASPFPIRQGLPL